MTGGRYRDLLRSRGFEAFLWTQFMGALNDNLCKWVVSLLAVSAAAGTGRGGEYLSWTNAVFMAPFFLFSGYAGHLADAFSKRTVLVVTKCAEVAAMALGLTALLTNQPNLMLTVLFLMALHSTFFSPAKYGIVPEMQPDQDLSRANGLLEMSTFAAIILGGSLGPAMVDFWKDGPWRIGVVLVVIACAGALASLGVPRVPAAGASQPFRWNPWAEVGAGLRTLRADRPLWLTVLAISYFWFLGDLFQMVLLLFGRETMQLDYLRTGLLGATLALGIGAGSMAAGRLSGDKVELGLVPLGSIGMGIFSILLSGSAGSYTRVIVALALLGFASGLFIVPLNAFLQQRSGRREKGRLIATNNFLNTAGMLLASAVLLLLHRYAHGSPERIILLFGLVSLLATVYIASVVPDFLIRFTLWMLTHSVYRIRIVGHQHVPFRGPALLVSNHVSLIDGFLVGACVQRFIRFLIYRPYYEMFRWLFRRMQAIPIGASGPRETVESLRQARRELEAGHVVCIFAEGAVSRTGNMLPFKSGFERIVKGLDVPIIPVHLDRLWGSIFSFKSGKFFWKWPERIPYPVTVSFGRPLPATATAQQVRQAVAELGSAAVHYRRTERDLLHLRFIRTAKRRWFSFSMADSSGQELTFGRALTAAMLLARWIRKQRPADEMVGLLLPASVGGALANAAALLAGKTPVNLNFTTGPEAMASAIEQCGIRTILTSRVFLARTKIEKREGMVFLEDLLKQITPLEKVWTAAKAFLLPARLLERLANPERHDPDYLATVVFSSGSTGAPKGILLSHHNILSNLEALAQVFWVTRGDRFLGVLPFFHSFGFTCTLWFPLVQGFGAVYHPNPMDAKAIGELVSKYKVTFLLSTPTFYATYLRKCSREEFATLRFALVGAEKLRESVAKPFQEKYGLSLCEGYGCTEMGPLSQHPGLRGRRGAEGVQARHGRPPCPRRGRESGGPGHRRAPARVPVRTAARQRSQPDDRLPGPARKNG